MTGSLGNGLLVGKTWEADPYVNDHKCESILRYIRILFGS